MGGRVFQVPKDRQALKTIFRTWDFILRTMPPLKGSMEEPQKQHAVELRHGKFRVLKMDGRRRKMIAAKNTEKITAALQVKGKDTLPPPFASRW